MLRKIDLFSEYCKRNVDKFLNNYNNITTIITLKQSIVINLSNYVSDKNNLRTSRFSRFIFQYTHWINHIKIKELFGGNRIF